MKKLTILLVVVILTASVSAQAPDKMSYQAVIRDAGNALVSNQAVGIKISILQGSNSGASVYKEIFNPNPTTNSNGLVTLEIGGGIPIFGNFTTIDWTAGPYFIKTETDPTGGTSYSITGTSELLSVPYALYSNSDNVTGLEKITEGSNTGWRLIGQNPANYGNIGIDAVDLSFNTTTSVILGATGENSIAMGNSTTSSGRYSTAIGFKTKATGLSSTAMGGTTVASGTASTAMGVQTNAQAYSSVVLGRFNLASGTPGSWVSTDPLFEIGNGTDASNLSNALTVYKNGRTDASGTIRSTGGTFPLTGEGEGISMSFINGRGYILSENPDNSLTYKEMVLGASVVRPINSIIDLGATDKRWLKVYTVNGISQSSDKRLKKDIEDLNYGLNNLMQLRPVSYKWKQGDQGLKLGLIAQEVQKVLPEVVDEGSDENKTLGMNYSELIPVLIKAIQELKTENSTMKAETQSKIEALVSRLNSLESSLNQ